MFKANCPPPNFPAWIKWIVTDSLPATIFPQQQPLIPPSSRRVGTRFGVHADYLIHEWAHGHKLQAGLSGIIGEAFREMVKDRTYAALESRARAHRATGGRAYGYRDGKIDRGEAFMVLEIFGRFADGMSARTIATDLNARRIPSPDSSWNRTQRRARGGMGSGSHYTITDQRSCGCSSFHDGRACSNSVRVRRDRIETILLDPIRKDLLTPERAERMAQEMQAYYLDRVRGCRRGQWSNLASYGSSPRGLSDYASG